jgi:two-component system NtrC family sensor kinase
MREMFKSSLSSMFDVVIAIPPDTWPIATDVAMFDLAVLNLLMNARDAMPKGGPITIAAQNHELTRGELSAELAGDFVALSVTDRGVGIPKDVLPNIFDPFFTTKNPDKGTGLGLSQVYGFVMQSGGDVTVASKLEEGTTVTLYFPRSRAAADAAEGASADPHAPHHARILVVDDNPEVATVTATLLEQLGYEARVANGPKRALDEIRSGAGYDLVFSDIVMPGGMNGVELALTLRAHDARLPIILATGYHDSVRDNDIPAEFPILRKPFKQVELGRVVASLLTSAQAARGK